MPGHFKLNVNGSRTMAGLIGSGGVFWDITGQWCCAFTRNIGYGDESWAL